MAQRKLGPARRAGQRLAATRDAHRSQRFHAFLTRWGKRHMPDRVTRFPVRA